MVESITINYLCFWDVESPGSQLHRLIIYGMYFNASGSCPSHLFWLLACHIVEIHWKISSNVVYRPKLKVSMTYLFTSCLFDFNITVLFLFPWFNFKTKWKSLSLCTSIWWIFHIKLISFKIWRSYSISLGNRSLLSYFLGHNSFK